MGTQAKWLAGVLVAALMASGWFGWQQARWRQVFYVETVNQLIYHLDMAERNLVRATETASYQEETEAMATAFGYLVSAHVESSALLKQLAPPRKGKPAFMPFHDVPMLIQYARNLSPDLPDAAVKRRIELLDGLEKAVAEGLSGVQGTPGYTFALDPETMRVDVPRLKQSLDDYFAAMRKPEEYTHILTFEDEPTKPAVSANWEGSDVALRVDWTRTYKLFPYDLADVWVLIGPRTSGRVTFTSDAGAQQRLGMGAFEPVEEVTLTAEQHEAWKERLPAGWAVGTYRVIRLAEGLHQTVTLRQGGGSELYLFNPRSGEKAEALPVGIRTLTN